MKARFFEDFTVGEQIQGGSRTVTDVEIAMLPALMGAINPLFFDEEAGRSTVHGGRILYGPALLGICIALTESLIHGTVIALLGIDKLRFTRSVRAGDTITAHIEVIGTKETSNPERGVVQVRDYAVNQHGERVIEFERAIMVRRRVPNL